MFELCELINAIHQHAERPKLTVPRAILIKLVSTKFDFQRYFSSNVTDMKTKAGKLAVFKTSFPKDQVAAVILANAEWAAAKPWGREINTAIDHIRQVYAYDHAHDAASVKKILEELQKANNTRNLRDAPAFAGQANEAFDLQRTEGARRLRLEDVSDESSIERNRCVRGGLRKHVVQRDRPQVTQQPRYEARQRQDQDTRPLDIAPCQQRLDGGEQPVQVL